jgi:putative ABC transport system permease protein
MPIVQFDPPSRLLRQLSVSRKSPLAAIFEISSGALPKLVRTTSFVALTGYGIGVGLCAAIIWLARLYLPDYAAVITYWNLALAFVMVVVIAAASSYVGVRKVLRIEPFDIFRG